MANTNSAQKSARVTERKHVRNRAAKSALKTYISKAEALIRKRDKEAAAAELKEAISALDSAAVKGIIHPNNAARRKSRLVQKFNSAFMEPKQVS